MDDSKSIGPRDLQLKVVSVQKSKVNNVIINGKEVPSGVHKETCEFINLIGDEVEGDLVADLKVHGGEFKAVYSYDRINYPLWEKLTIDSSGGSMSENITTEGLDEEKLFIGDRLIFSEVILEVTQPRFPCQKLNIKMKDTGAIKKFLELNRPGVYYKIIKEGVVKPDESIQLDKSHSTNVRFLDLFEFLKGNKQSTVLALKEYPNLDPRLAKKLFRGD